MIGCNRDNRKIFTSLRILPFSHDNKTDSRYRVSVSDNIALRISKLGVSFQAGRLELRAVDRVSLDLKQGRHTALLGETSCGKSVLALAVFGLLPPNAAVTGKISARGYEDLLSLSQKKINALRGRFIVLIPQNPHGSLNPAFRIKRQLAESIRLVRQNNPMKMRDRIHELLSKTGFTEPEKVARMYPHQLSGGMAQRVILAAGLAGVPDIVIADEPTKGLDAEIAEQCLKVLKVGFKNSAMLLITHDLNTASVCDEAAVMYAGEIVEQGPADAIITHPLHPYTRGLIGAHPAKGLRPIPGYAPGLASIPKGCRFQPRCPEADILCGKKHPELSGKGERLVRCFHAGN